MQNNFPRRRVTTGRGAQHLPSQQSIEAIVNAETQAISILLDLLDRCQITQAELARRLGVSPTAVNQLVRGTNAPTLRRLAEIADVLGYELHLEVRPKGSCGPADHILALELERDSAFQGYENAVAANRDLQLRFHELETAAQQVAWVVSPHNLEALRHALAGQPRSSAIPSQGNPDD